MTDTATATLRTKRWRVRRARHGAPMRVDAGPTRARLADLRNCGLFYRDIAEGVGRCVNQVRRIELGSRWVTPETEAAVEAMWDHYCGDHVRLEPDGRRFPADPLISLVAARYGSLEASGVRDQLARLRREQMSWEQCEDWSARFGVLPEELWPEWAA